MACVPGPVVQVRYTSAVENFDPEDFVVLANGILCIQTTFGRNWGFTCTGKMKQKAKIRNPCENSPIFHWGKKKLRINRSVLAHS